MIIAIKCQYRSKENWSPEIQVVVGKSPICAMNGSFYHASKVNILDHALKNIYRLTLYVMPIRILTLLQPLAEKIDVNNSD